MKIAYIANARMPTEKAHGLQVMHMCRAFALVGHDVTLVVPKRKNWIDKTIWEFYDAEPLFKIVEVSIIDFIVWDKWLGNLALWLETLWFGKNGRRVIEELAPDVVYSRDPFSSAWTPRWIPHVFEAHTFPNRALWLYRWLWNKCDRIVTVTDGLKRMFAAQGVPEWRLRTAADAVDLEAFVVDETRHDARRKLDLPPDAFLVVYAGHLYPYKGIPDLIEACQWLNPGIRVAIVGGRPEDLARTKEAAAKFGLKNVIFVGRVPHKEVPLYLRAADLAVMPYTRESHHVEYYSSPLKLFEYLAAGRAIISTDLPSVREVLDDRLAEFVPAEDPKALADGINRLQASPARVAELERSSAELATHYTWTERARAVLDAMPKPRVEWKLTFYRKYRLEIHLALLAFVLRAAYVTLVPQLALTGGDGVLYIGLADVIRGVRPPSESFPIFFQPLYPYLLAAVRSVFGENLVWGRLVQAAMSSATVFLAALIARRWISAYAAWVAGLIGALYVPMILESGIYYTETTYAFLLTAGVLAFLHALETKKTVHALLCGAVFLLAGFTRELGLYVAILLALYAIFRKAPKTGVIILLIVAASIAGSSYRNRIVARTHPREFVPIVAKGYESTVMEKGFRESAFSPDRLYLYPVGVYRYLRFPFRLIDVSDETSVKRVLLSGDRAAIVVALPQIFAKSLLLLFHWLILLLAGLGIFRGVIDRRVKETLLIVILFAAATIILGSVGRQLAFELFEPLARYRFPTEPLIIVLAAAGVERWSRRRDDLPASGKPS